jgi:type II secretory pathway component PulK
VDASEIGTVTSSILDWMDPDDDTHIGGAESAFYQHLNPPYSAKNGPLDDLTELLMINGVTPEMYWGPARSSVAGGYPRTVLQRRTPAGGASYAAGLVDLFCVVGNPRLNINTADQKVLMLIPGIDENLASAIIQARSGPDGVSGNEDDMPFRNLMEVASAVPGVDPAIVQELARYCDIRSATFEVDVKAEIGDLRRHYVALLRRNQPQDVQILQFYWK